MFTPADLRAIFEARGQWRAILRTRELPVHPPVEKHAVQIHAVLATIEDHDPLQMAQAVQDGTLVSYYAVDPCANPRLVEDRRLPWFDYFVTHGLISLPDFQVRHPGSSPFFSSMN